MNTKGKHGAELRRMIGIQFFAESPGDDGAAFAPEDTTPPDTGGQEGAESGQGVIPENDLESIFGDEEDWAGADGVPEDDGEPSPPEGTAQEATYPVQIDGETVQLTPAQMAERLATGVAPNPEQISQLVQQQIAQHPAMQLVESKARASGMTVDQYLQAMQQQEKVAEVQQIMQQTGLSKELAQELAESRAFRERMQQQAQEAAKQQEQNQMYAAFIENFPDMPAKDIPQEVWQQVERGMDLTAAYALHRVKALEAENKTLRQNAHVREKAIGSATGVEQSGGRDPVIDGLNGKLW